MKSIDKTNDQCFPQAKESKSREQRLKERGKRFKGASIILNRGWWVCRTNLQRMFKRPLDRFLDWKNGPNSGKQVLLRKAPRSTGLSWAAGPVSML